MEKALANLQERGSWTGHGQMCWCMTSQIYSCMIFCHCYWLCCWAFNRLHNQWCKQPQSGLLLVLLKGLVWFLVLNHSKKFNCEQISMFVESPNRISCGFCFNSGFLLSSRVVECSGLGCLVNRFSHLSCGSLHSSDIANTIGRLWLRW